MRRRWKQVALLCLIALPAGCGGCCCVGPPDRYPIRGRVIALAPDAPDELHSSLSPSIHEPRPDEQVVAGARIYLAHDEMGKDPVPGSETTSGKDGFYDIATKDLARPKAQDGWYYLIVEKDGFVPIRHHMFPGFMSSYLENTAQLRPIRK